MARAVKADPADLAGYDWSGRTIKRHRTEIRQHFGFQQCAARAAVRELARLLTTMAGCASAFALPGRACPPHLLEAHERAEHDARAALRHAAVRMRVAASVLGDGEEDHDHTHPVVTRLAGAADCLAAGHDLLQTHFTHDWPRARRGNSPWAPLITSTPVNQALLARVSNDLVPGVMSSLVRPDSGARLGV